MASIPHFYSNYQFSPEEFSEITSVIAQENYGGCNATFATKNSNNATISPGSTGAILGHDQINFPVYYENNNGGIEGFRSETEILSRVPVTTSCFSGDQFRVSDMAVPSSSSSSSSFMDYKFGLSNIAKIQNFGSGFQFPDACDQFGEDWCEFVPNCKSVCPEFAGDNWGIQCNQMPAMEHNNIKVGRYTVEERKDRILRYLKKRNQRNFNKTIKYACRKTLADRRVRVRGRFARNNELCEDENGGNKNDNALHDKEWYSNESLEMKNDNDDWLQEAVASLMCVPYIAG